MATITLSDASRYEARIRAFWRAEPQRGPYIQATDDAARAQLLAEAGQFGLDFWAAVEGEAVETPDDLGDFIMSAHRFSILGVIVAAFPSAAIRDAVVEATPGARAIPDDAFWP